jgi:hypothetical protein
MADGAWPSQTQRIGKLPHCDGVRLGQPVGALATSSDGEDGAADPLAARPVQVPSGPASCLSCRCPPAFAPAVMIPQVRPLYSGLATQATKMAYDTLSSMMERQRSTKQTRSS